MLALTASVSLAFLSYLPIQLFDSERWKQVERSDDYTRLEMIESLTLGGKLNDASRSEVVELLGPVDETAYFSDWDSVYRLGPQRSIFRIVSEWLVIRFDEDGIVSEYRVVSD